MQVRDDPVLRRLDGGTSNKMAVVNRRPPCIWGFVSADNCYSRRMLLWSGGSRRHLHDQLARNHLGTTTRETNPDISCMHPVPFR